MRLAVEDEGVELEDEALEIAGKGALPAVETGERLASLAVLVEGLGLEAEGLLQGERGGEAFLFAEFLDALVEPGGFEGADAAAAEVEEGDFSGEAGFILGGGLPFFEGIAEQFLVGFTLDRGEAGDGKEEAVAAGVLGGAGFAFRGAGSGGLTGVEAVGFELGWGRHRGEFSWDIG
jgi:hypothetical protein